MKKIFSTFGQELYQSDSIKAIETFYDISDNEILLQSIVNILPHKSLKTKTRVAEKIIQRFFNRDLPAQDIKSYLQMVRMSTSIQDKLDLIYWRTARTDKIIAAIASEIFYPFFINNQIPGKYSQEQFDKINTFTLFSIDRVITTSFIEAYSLSAWYYTSRKSILLSLRVMKQANLINSISISSGYNNILGYYVIQHYINSNIFAFCLFEEFYSRNNIRLLSLDQVYESDSVKLFFLSKLQIDTIIKNIAKNHVVKIINQYGGRYIQFLYSDIASLTSALTGMKNE